MEGTEEKLCFYFFTVELKNEMSEAEDKTGCSLQLLLAPVTLASGTGLYPRIFFSVLRNSLELGATNFRGPNAVKATPAMIPSVSCSKSKKTRHSQFEDTLFLIHHRVLFRRALSFAGRSAPPIEVGQDLPRVFCTSTRRPRAPSAQGSLRAKHF